LSYSCLLSVKIHVSYSHTDYKIASIARRPCGFLPIPRNGYVAIGIRTSFYQNDEAAVPIRVLHRKDVVTTGIRSSFYYDGEETIFICNEHRNTLLHP